ncbi:MAG: hypothetical protein NC543_12975 [bacterium]|nr:hypothetical protein [bacterium]
MRSLTVGVIASFGWALTEVAWGTQSWLAFGVGLMPGVIMLLLSRVTREQIGRGDAWELMHMGNWLGWTDCLAALSVALLGIFIVSVLLLFFGKAGRNTRIPFVPFLCAGVVVRLVCIWI